MCPACLASAAWMVSGAISTGGVGALLVKKLRVNKTTTDSTQRRNEDGYGNDRETKREGGVTSGVAGSEKRIAGEGEGIHAPA